MTAENKTFPDNFDDVASNEPRGLAAISGGVGEFAARHINDDGMKPYINKSVEMGLSAENTMQWMAAVGDNLNDAKNRVLVRMAAVAVIVQLAGACGDLDTTSSGSESQDGTAVATEVLTDVESPIATSTADLSTTESIRPPEQVQALLPAALYDLDMSRDDAGNLVNPNTLAIYEALTEGTSSIEGADVDNALIRSVTSDSDTLHYAIVEVGDIGYSVFVITEEGDGEYDVHTSSPNLETGTDGTPQSLSFSSQVSGVEIVFGFDTEGAFDWMTVNTDDGSYDVDTNGVDPTDLSGAQTVTQAFLPVSGSELPVSSGSVDTGEGPGDSGAMATLTPETNEPELATPTPLPPPTPVETPEQTEVPESEVIGSEAITELVVEAIGVGEEVIQVEDPIGVEVSIDVVPQEVLDQGEWNWDYRGFVRETENGTQVFRTLQGVGENDNGRWLTIMSEMNVPGHGLVTIEYNPDEMEGLYGFSNIEAANVDNWQTVLDGIWGDKDAREVAEKLNHITSSDIAQTGLQDMSIYRTETAYRGAGLSIILSGEYEERMYLAESWNGAPSMAFDGNVDGGRPQLEMYSRYWRAPTFDDADGADYIIAYATLTSVDWLLHQSNGAGEVPGLTDFARSDMNPWKEILSTGEFPLPRRNADILRSVGYNPDDIFNTANVGMFVQRTD